MTAALLALLLAQPAYYLERPDPTRQARLELVAAELAAYPPDVAAGLAVIGHRESGWARYVAEGCYQVPRRAPNCDGGRALGYWQLHRGACPAAWLSPPWTRASLHEQVACAVRLWDGASRRCLPSGGGFGCIWADRSWSATRWATAYSVLQRGSRGH
jgi:hypothetical protein